MLLFILIPNVFNKTAPAEYLFFQTSSNTKQTELSGLFMALNMNAAFGGNDDTVE